MAEVVLRSEKGEPLSHAEVDANFHNLNQAKLEASQFNANSTLLARDKDGNLVPVSVAEQRILGRLTGGNIKGLTIAEVKTLLAIAINEVVGLTDALASKASATDLDNLQDEVDGISEDVTDLEGAVDEIQGALGGLSVFAHGTEALVAGEKAVVVADMLSTDYVVIGRHAAGGTLGALYTSGSEAGGFMAKSTSNEDTSIIYYIVYRPAV